MSTLLGIVDFIVLLLIVVVILRTVWMKPPQGSGSLVLSIFVALALIVFATVSLAAYWGLVQDSSSLTQGIFLVILLVMAVLLRLSWSVKPVSLT
jgi:hypothetical protein